MKIISKKSFFVNNILSKQKYDINIKYRKIKFIVEEKVDEGILIFNYLTFELILLSNEEYLNFSSKIEDKLFSYYVENWFYVQEDFDEIKTCYQIMDFARAINYGMNYRQYTIFSTMQCNARCFYCFENGKKRESMTLETAKYVSEYIIKNHNNAINQLRWFGGEPLYNTDVIDLICENLRKNNIPFTSGFTSNAYLFSEECIVRAINCWNMQSVHTTLDGTQEIYNKTKNYIYKEDNNPFKTVINNIHNLLKHKIKVMVRMNLSENNSNDIERLIAYLSEEFCEEKDFSMYVSLLHKSDSSGFSSDSAEQFDEQAETLIKLSNKIFNKGFSISTIQKDISANICKADSDSSVVILPNGNFTRCENMFQENRLGNVFGETPEKTLYNSWKEYAEVLDDCRNCSLVPKCISLRNCTHGGRKNKCGLSIKKIKLNSARLAMKNTYVKYLNQEKNRNKTE